METAKHEFHLYTLFTSPICCTFFDAAQASASLDAEVGDEATNLAAKYSNSGDAIDILAKLKGEMGITEPAPSSETAEDILARLQD